MEKFVPVAGNGLLDRREFLRGGAALAAAMTGYSVKAETLSEQPWSKEPGMLVPPYGVPSRYEKAVARTLSNPNGEPRTQHARTPHHLLQGTATPNGLHFTISHAGNADIDPAQHRLDVGVAGMREDRKSTRLNSSHQIISYAVFCLKKKKPTQNKSPSTLSPCDPLHSPPM